MPSPKATRRRETATSENVSDGSHGAIVALTTQILEAHKTTNQLMSVQFENVKESMKGLYGVIKETKAELQKENDEIKETVEINRSVADDRHIALVKKIWTGVGLVAALSVILELLIAIKK